MSDETQGLPEFDGNLGGDGVSVNPPDTTGGQQFPDTIPEPQPMPEPEEKDEPGRPGPMPGPSGFSLR